MIHLYGFDPGKTTGFFHGLIRDGKMAPLDAKEMDYKQVLKWCADEIENPELGHTILIAEDYTIDPITSGYSHQGDKGLAMRLLGALELTATLAGYPFVLQQRDRKPAGYGFAGGKYVKGKKGQHMQDALAHVTYYAVTQKMMVPPAPRKVPLPVSQKASSPRIFRTQSGSQWRKPDTP